MSQENKVNENEEKKDVQLSAPAGGDESKDVDNEVDKKDVQLSAPAGSDESKDVDNEVDKKDSQFSDIFVTESDTFNVIVRYYKKKGNLIVENIDDEFDPKVSSKSFSITFKYPDQGDAGRITGQAGRLGASGIEDMDVREFLNLEFARVLCLVRSWTVDQDLTNQNILKLHPKIVKAIINQVREELGMDGII